MSIEKIISEFKNQIEWEIALNNRGEVHESPAIYAIVTLAPFTRLQSLSRIMYIGKTGCLGGDSDLCRLYTVTGMLQMVSRVQE
ncbi:hypothetical protein [Methylomonas sp. AM2-LC]|uniref:hypothetical protein n=1 Tax=Methylomonas sp. AM2-LC TaxID=3153301 RepID=UPI003266ED15